MWMSLMIIKKFTGNNTFSLSIFSYSLTILNELNHLEGCRNLKIFRNLILRLTKNFRQIFVTNSIKIATLFPVKARIVRIEVSITNDQQDTTAIYPKNPLSKYFFIKLFYP